MNAPASEISSAPSKPAFPLAAIHDSARFPLLVLVLSGAVWLLVGSLFAFIATLKFHKADFLADCSWLTYGRVRPAAINCILYGFCIQAGLGAMLWSFCRLGRTLLVQPWLILLGAIMWNLGVTIGVVGILAGDSTGFENLEMPFYAALLLFLGYLLIGLWGLMTFHLRTERRLVPSHWFLVAALFWFPWIYSSAYFLLVISPIRGVAQAVIAWWYSNNLYLIWLGFVGLGLGLYFIPKLSGRPLRGYYLALISFWLFMLFGSWGGVPHSAPAPAWIPALSSAGTGLLLLPLIIVGMMIRQTLGRLFPQAADAPALKFILIGTICFLLAGLLIIISSLVTVTDLTWFVPAKWQLFHYGFFSLVLFGCIYSIVPQLTGIEFPAGAVRLHYVLAIAGVVLSIVPLAIGGVVEGLKMRNPAIDFMQVAKTALMFLRISSLGDLLLIGANALFLRNLMVVVGALYRARAAAAYAAATTDIKPAEVRA